MKNPILIILLFLIIGEFAFSQEPTVDTCDLLTNKTWVMDDLTDKKISSFFTSTKENVHLNNELIAISDYYLSNVIVEIFDETKVGNIRNGKYIVCCMDQTREQISIYEIIIISENKLELRNILQSTTSKYTIESD